MQGNLLTASFDNTIQRVVLNATGDATTLVEPLFSNVGSIPLDVIGRGDLETYPGTIWVAEYADDEIVIFEPVDFVSCSGARHTRFVQVELRSFQLDRYLHQFKLGHCDRVPFIQPRGSFLDTLLQELGCHAMASTSSTSTGRRLR